MPVSPITPSSAPPVIIHELVDWAALASPLTYAASSCASITSEAAPPVTLRMAEGLARCHTSVITLQMLCGPVRLDTTMKRAGASLSQCRTRPKSMVPYVAGTLLPSSSCLCSMSFSKSSSSSLSVEAFSSLSLVSGLRHKLIFGIPPDMAACSALREMCRCGSAMSQSRSAWACTERFAFRAHGVRAQ